MTDIAIRVESISKRYHIGKRQEKSVTLRDKLANGFTAPFRRAKHIIQGQATGAADLDQVVWALKDVSFDVERGEIVGIIGRNGAGKSTLLKILSRITEPTTGFARIRGRVGSLLEVGTGFHQELTGRENIYLNGAILGMTAAEIDRKFDEIVAFSEIEKFIDTPVKHYSSGMALRLAFAVAAHLEPEILIIDEVLAVGDARFQRKCVSKMQDVGQQGRTVLFVSHNMAAVTRLCERVILVHDGQLIADGQAHEVVRYYLDAGGGTAAVREWTDPASAPSGKVARLRAVRVRTEDGEINEGIDIRRPVGIEMEYEVLESGHILMPHHRFFNENGVHVFSANDVDPEWRQTPRPAGRYISTAWIPGNFLAEGTIYVHSGAVTLSPYSRQFHEHNVVAFQVIDSIDGDSARGDWHRNMGGVVRPLLNWTTEYSALSNGHEPAVKLASHSETSFNKRE